MSPALANGIRASHHRKDQQSTEERGSKIACHPPQHAVECSLGASDRNLTTEEKREGHHSVCFQKYPL